MIKKFTLGGVEWQIEVKNEKLDDKECYGLSVFNESKIYMQTKTHDKNRAITAIECSLYHEVVHAILDTLGEHELSSDEKFVERFSVLLHQFEKTKE